MRKPVALLVSLVLVSAFGAATVEIVQPDEGPITENALVPLNVTTDVSNAYANYSLNGGPEQFCWCLDPGNVTILTLEEGYNMINVTVYEHSGSNPESDGVRTFVDTKAPKITGITPEGAVFDLRPTIEIKYEDETSGINTSRVEATLEWPNGTTTVLPGDATADAFTYTPDSDLPEGEYALSYHVTDTVDNVLESDTPMTFTLPERPVLSAETPKETFTTADPTIELRARDPSGIDLSVSEFVIDRPSGDDIVVGGEDLEVDKEEGMRDVNLSYDLSGLGDGEHAVEATIADTNGEERTAEWTFTVDTTPPVVDELSHTEEDLISGDEEVRVRGHDALGDVAEASFSVGGETAVDKEADASDWFAGTLNTLQVEEGFQQLQVSVWDEAGNPVSRTVNVTVDNTPPQFTAPLEVYPKTAASHVRVTGVVEDKAAGVDAVTYTVNGTGIDDDLAAVDGTFDDREEEFAGVVDVSSLDSGRHTLYVRAEDDAGHRSGKAGASFTVQEDAAASLAFAAPANVTVERGKEVSHTVGVKNTGDVAEYVALEASSERNVTVATGARKIGPGETKQFRLTVVGGRTAGTFPLTLTAEGLAADATWTGAVIVQPRPAEQERIEERFATLQERFQELNASSAAYGLEAEALERKLSSAGEAVEDVEGLLEQGRYRAAEQRLDETKQLIAGTESTFTGQMTRYRAGQAASLFLHLVLFAVAAFATVFGYRAYRVEDGRAPQQAGMDEIRAQFQEVVDRFRGEDEQQPSGWQGFG